MALKSFFIVIFLLSIASLLQFANADIELSHAYDSDDNERLIKEVGFDGRTQEYDYNARGELRAWRDPQRTARYLRDYMGRVTAVQYRPRSNSAQINDAYGPRDPQNRNESYTAEYAYDAMGRLIKANNPHRHLSFAYNAAGDLIEEQQDQQRTTHQYDEITGERSQTQLPDGKIVAYRFDAKQQLTDISLDQQPLTQHQYDAYGREHTRHCGALTLNQDYDPLGRLQSQKAYKASLGRSPIIQRDYGYNPLDQLTSKRDHHRGHQHYRYSPRGQLTQIDHQDRYGQASGTSEYHFDPAGHLIDIHEATDQSQAHNTAQNKQNNGQNPDWAEDSIHVNPSNSEAIHNARLMVQNDKTYAYDDSGNRIRQWRGKDHATETEYRYNLVGELDRVIDKRHHWHTVAEFQYDALGRRIQKTITTHAHDDASRIKQHYHDHYLWLGDVLLQEQRHTIIDKAAQHNRSAEQTTPIQQNTASSAPEPEPEHIITYLHEPDSFRPLAQIHERPQKHSRDIYYYQLDHLGTPMEMTNDEGHIVWSANYQGFGKAKTQRGIVGNDSIRNPIRFQGQYEDEETGLHYNRFRYYDPLSGQYTQQDPIGLEGGTPLLSQYVDDPVGWIDPLGLVKKKPCETTKNKKPQRKYMEPDERAAGPHTVWKKNNKGEITNHQTFEPNTNPNYSSNWVKGNRTDVSGKSEYNKTTKEFVDTPHTHTTSAPGGIRPAKPNELPRNKL